MPRPDAQYRSVSSMTRTRKPSGAYVSSYLPPMWTRTYHDLRSDPSLISARSSAQLPVGLINAGLASNASGSLYASVSHGFRKQQNHAIFLVHAAECHSLKSALKTIIQRGTASVEIDSEEGDLLDMREVHPLPYLTLLLNADQGRRLLNYDLQALHNYASNGRITRCVVFFQNSEALDPQVLAELVDILL